MGLGVFGGVFKFVAGGEGGGGVRIALLIRIYYLWVFRLDRKKKIKEDWNE